MEYAKMPLEVFRDLRLSKNDLRVLAVLIFRSNKEGKCWPSLANISALSGLPKSRISEHTNRLKKFGLIDKKPREKGRNNQLIYTVFCQQSTSQVYTEPVYTDYTEPVYTTPITIKHKTLNIDKDASVSAKRISVFSKADILSVKIPENLATEKGFIPAWEKWVETKVNQSQKRNRFSDAKEVEEELQILVESFAEGLDIITGMKTAARRKWIGFEKHYFHMRNNQKPKLTKDEEIDEAMDNFIKNENENNGIRNERNSADSVRSLPEFSGESVYN